MAGRIARDETWVFKSFMSKTSIYMTDENIGYDKDGNPDPAGVGLDCSDKTLIYR